MYWVCGKCWRKLACSRGESYVGLIVSRKLMVVFRNYIEKYILKGGSVKDFTREREREMSLYDIEYLILSKETIYVHGLLFLLI
jgi:hypothetical protein